MKISSDCVEIVKALEGLRLTAYHCPAGVATIGYGHTGPDVQPGQRVTQPVAEQLLYGDLQTAASGVAAALSKHKLTVTQDQADALVSFAFNVGSGAFAKSSILRRLATGDIPGAAEALLAWNKAHVGGALTALPGLTRRREAERALFLGDVPRAFAIAGVAGSGGEMAQAVEPPEKAKRLDTSPTIAGGVTSIAGGLATAATALTQFSDSAKEAFAAAPIPAHWFLLLIGVAVLVAGAVVVVRRYGYWASADKIETEIVSFAKSALPRIAEEAPSVSDIIAAAESAAAAARSVGAAAAPVVREVAGSAVDFSQFLARALAARRARAVNADGVVVRKGP